MLTINLYKTTHIPLSILQFILLKYHDNSFFIIIIIFLKTSPNRPTHSPRRHLYPQPQTHWQLQPQTTPATTNHPGNQSPPWQPQTHALDPTISHLRSSTPQAPSQTQSKKKKSQIQHKFRAQRSNKKNPKVITHGHRNSNEIRKPHIQISDTDGKCPRMSTSTCE